jgi:Ala-tRNA(Pro) deacylase
MTGDVIMISHRLKSYLEEQAVPYHLIPHRRDFTAQEAAACTHTKGREFAKTVVLAVDGGYAVAVVPAPRRVDLRKLRQLLGVHDLRLADEEEIRRLCPDCEVGAEPPFGNLYGLPVYLSRELTEDEEITFNAGTHEEVMRIQMRDYERVVKPRVVDLAT